MTDEQSYYIFKYRHKGDTDFKIMQRLLRGDELEAVEAVFNNTAPKDMVCEFLFVHIVDPWGTDILTQNQLSLIRDTRFFKTTIKEDGRQISITAEGSFSLKFSDVYNRKKFTGWGDCGDYDDDSDSLMHCVDQALEGRQGAARGCRPERQEGAMTGLA